MNEEKDIKEKETPSKHKSKGKVVWEWMRVVIIALAIGLFVSKVIILNATVPTGSMEETVMTGDRVIGLRTAYWFSSPERGDVVIFKYPDDESQQFLKRVIGLPGEKVEIIDGKVFINDELLVEDYLPEEPYGSYGPYYVPDGYYFMLGDNRNYSRDSRFWTNTYVSEKKILAKVYFSYYPHLGWVE